MEDDSNRELLELLREIKSTVDNHSDKIANLQKQHTELRDVVKIIMSPRKLDKRKKAIQPSSGHELQPNESFTRLGEIEFLHDEVIREHLPRMVDDMELKNTYLVDELIQEDCLTSDEGSEIRRAGNRHDQTRKLCRIISKRSAKKFEIFLKRLGEKNNYPPIAQDLTDCYNKKKQKYSEYSFDETEKRICVLCAIKKKVNLKDMVDVLIQHDIVDWDFLDRIGTSDDANNEWMHVFENISSSEDRSNRIQSLGSALSKKHPEITQLLKEQPFFDLNCHCVVSFSNVQNTTSLSSNGYHTTSTDERYTETSIPSDKSETLPIAESHRYQKAQNPKTKVKNWLLRNRKQTGRVVRSHSNPTFFSSHTQYADDEEMELAHDIGKQRNALPVEHTEVLHNNSFQSLNKKYKTVKTGAQMDLKDMNQNMSIPDTATSDEKIESTHHKEIKENPNLSKRKQEPNSKSIQLPLKKSDGELNTTDGDKMQRHAKDQNQEKLVHIGVSKKSFTNVAIRDYAETTSVVATKGRMLNNKSKREHVNNKPKGMIDDILIQMLQPKQPDTNGQQDFGTDKDIQDHKRQDEQFDNINHHQAGMMSVVETNDTPSKEPRQMFDSNSEQINQYKERDNNYRKVSSESMIHENDSVTSNNSEGKHTDSIERKSKRLFNFWRELERRINP